MEQVQLPLWVEYVRALGTPVVSFLAAIAGLWLASWLTELREGRKEKIRIDKEAIYIAILVTAHLERVVSSCLQIAYDDGMVEGHPSGPHGTYLPTAATPVFDPLQIETDWRLLPNKLMQTVLELPHKIERLKNNHAGIADLDFAPDYTDYFRTRQYDFAKLGLDTVKLMSDLRVHAGIPFEDPIEEEDLTPGHWFREKIKKIETVRIEDGKRREEG